jgi:hypothetical protein
VTLFRRLKVMKAATALGTVVWVKGKGKTKHAYAAGAEIEPQPVSGKPARKRYKGPRKSVRLKWVEQDAQRLQELIEASRAMEYWREWGTPLQAEAPAYVIPSLAGSLAQSPALQSAHKIASNELQKLFEMVGES